MALALDAWDAYRLFCVSSTAPPAFTEELPAFAEKEMADRLGLVEDYLTGWDAVTRACHASHAKLCCRARQSLEADEAEERRFISEDADYMPYWLFARVISEAAQRRLVSLEEAARQSVVVAFFDSLRACVLTQYEQLRRMQVTSEALDSLAVKACVVGRSGLRDGQLARTTAPGPVFTPSVISQVAAPSSFLSLDSTVAGALLRSEAATMVVNQEQGERQLLQHTRTQFMMTAMTVLLAKREERRASAEVERIDSVPVR